MSNVLVSIFSLCSAGSAIFSSIPAKYCDAIGEMSELEASPRET